jgi:hypothetical protein
MLDFLIFNGVMLFALFVSFAIIFGSFALMEKEFLDRS